MKETAATQPLLNGASHTWQGRILNCFLGPKYNVLKKTQMIDRLSNLLIYWFIELTQKVIYIYIDQQLANIYS